MEELIDIDYDKDKIKNIKDAVDKSNNNKDKKEESMTNEEKKIMKQNKYQK